MGFEFFSLSRMFTTERPLMDGMEDMDSFYEGEEEDGSDKETPLTEKGQPPKDSSIIIPPMAAGDMDLKEGDTITLKIVGSGKHGFKAMLMPRAAKELEKEDEYPDPGADIDAMAVEPS